MNSTTILLRCILTTLFVFSPSHTAPLTVSDDKDTDLTWKFLSKFGYLQTMPEVQHDMFMLDDVLLKAISEFQRFNGLKVTGVLDTETRDKMDKPRCGIPDVLESDAVVTEGDSNLHVPLAYSIYGDRWWKPTVTWTLSNMSNQLPESIQLSTFENAIALWQQEIPKRFKFQPITANPDIKISFGVGDHGDGIGERFDGKGHILAHAFRPGDGLGGDAHFDDDEDWSVNGTGTDLLTVAVHELGHSLGLRHSSVPTAVMAPYYVYRGKVKLDRDDLRGIRALYGRPGSNSRYSSTFTRENNLEIRTESTIEINVLFEKSDVSYNHNGVSTVIVARSRSIWFWTHQVLLQFCICQLLASNLNFKILNCCFYLILMMSRDFS